MNEIILSFLQPFHSVFKIKDDEFGNKMEGMILFFKIILAFILKCLDSIMFSRMPLTTFNKYSQTKTFPKFQTCLV